MWRFVPHPAWFWAMWVCYFVAMGFLAAGWVAAVFCWLLAALYVVLAWWEVRRGKKGKK